MTTFTYRSLHLTNVYYSSKWPLPPQTQRNLVVYFQLVCPSMWPYWTCSKRIHPPTQWFSLSFNPSGSQTNKPKEYTQWSQWMSWAFCSHQSSKVSYLLSSRLPGQKAGHQATMSLIMQGTHSKLSSLTETSFTRLEERDRNLPIPIRGGGRDSQHSFLQRNSANPTTQPIQLWWRWSLFIVMESLTSLSDISLWYVIAIES